MHLLSLILISFFSQGNPGVPVHLTGQQRWGRYSWSQWALLGLPNRPRRQFSSLIQHGDWPTVICTHGCSNEFWRAVAYCHGAIMQGTGRDDQVRGRNEHKGRSNFLPGRNHPCWNYPCMRSLVISNLNLRDFPPRDLHLVSHSCSKSFF